MKNYYAIYPGPNGLDIQPLGPCQDFDMADEADRNSFTPGLREPSIWILDRDELMILEDNIRKAGEVNAN